MLQRHQLVYVARDASFSIYSCHDGQEAIREQVVEWIKKGLPCVYARQSADDDRVNLGLPLTLKHRVALKVDQSCIIKYQPLPRLIMMEDFFSQFYKIDGIKIALGPLANMIISVYGSFLFHYLSGQRYVDKKSDLDLLIDYPGCTLNVLNELIQLLTKKFNRPIDGEVRFQHVGDIAIKELLDLSTKKLLCKHQMGVELRTRVELYEHYPSLCYC